MQVPILCTPELRREESHVLWVCNSHERELNPLLGPGLQIQNEIPRLTQLNLFLSRGKGDPSLSLSGCPFYEWDKES